VYATPTSSSSLKVEWDGVSPNHGQVPSSYRLDFYDLDDISSDSVASHTVSEIDEASRYSVVKTDLNPETRYKVLIIPVNELGEGGPSWYSDFNPSGTFHDDEYDTPQNYLEMACHAVPTCQRESVECTEDDTGNFAIVARSVPPPPMIDVGTYPSVSTQNRFTKDSILVSFQSPLTVNTNNNGMPTDKFLVEWSTTSSFSQSIDGLEDTLWSSEVTARYSDENDEDAVGELLIESLTMGTQYFVRVSAHNTAGFGTTTNSVPATPMTRSDPPFEPILSSLTSNSLASLQPTDSSLSDSALIGTSLLCKWQPPRVDSSNDRPDLVGDGGSDVSSYLVEWSRIAFDQYTPTVFEINLETASGLGGSAAFSVLTGSFQIQFDTSASSEPVVSGSYVSASIPVDVSTDMLKQILENIPNVGEVQVESPEPLSWRITFLTELGDVDLSLADNKVVDDSLVAGTVDITKTTVGIIPTNAAYNYEIVNDINALTTDDGYIHYIIEHLVPGMKVFVRISAGNQVGYGPRRTTAPEFSSPTLQRPDVPVSLYTDDMPPYLSVHSPTALEVHVGPPSYDGGSPLTSFLIEWDSSSTFDSSPLGDGSSLGSIQASATSQVCSSCVGEFDVTTDTFTYSGNDDTSNLLIPQRKIMVYFHDDNESYLFTISSATSSTITVSNEHLRVASLSNMKDSNGGVDSNLELLGTTHIIYGLETGRAYYVRVSSENGEMGTGRSIGTMPLSAIPRDLPLPPSTAAISVVDKNTLSLSWSSDAYHNDPTIQAFKVERFWKSEAASVSSFSFFGEQEVVQFSTSGLGLTGGSFHLYFGDLDDESTNVLLGTAKVTNGLDYIETLVDLSPHLHRREFILIGDEQYIVHETDPFTSTRLPLSTTYSGLNTETAPIYTRSKSMPISHDASAQEVCNALERMPHVNHVEVRREDDDAFDNGYEWFVTFTSNVGPQPDFSVDTSNLIGTNPLGFTITRIVPGVLPDEYDVTLIEDPTVTSHEMDNLLTGKQYYVRVSSIAERGESLPQVSSPLSLSPGGVPGDIPSPRIRSLNETTLLVSFEAAAQANGAPVQEYIVEASSDSSFTDNHSEITVHPNHKVQRVTTRAHTLPWGETASFTLSLGDYHGDFTIPVGQGSTTVRVQNGDNVLERSTGTTSLSSAVARGDFISVGGTEFRVCLSDSQLYDDSHLSLCSKDDALVEANFSTDNSALDVIDELPIFILDTSLGAAKSPSIGDVFLSTVDATGSSNDTRDRLQRGDLIRVGHPESGETFRVSTDTGRAFTDQVIPLSSTDDANVPASLSSKSLQHSTYEIQSFSIRSSDETVALTPSSVLSSGFRVRFQSEITQTTTDGGAEGCLKWDGDANDMKLELETLLGIDGVEVSRDELSSIPGGVGAGVNYKITFTGLNVRGNIPPLQVVDVGSNGCLDAHTLGGTFGQDLAPITVQQVEIPYVPFYEIQTTNAIPFDASSADMKASLEALSQACTVDVSREINRHGYSWDVTFVHIEGSTYSPLLALSANTENLSADIDPGVSIVDVQHVEVPIETEGVAYFARVAAFNSFGMGPYTSSNPRAIEVSPQPPSKPVDVFAEVISDSEVLVQWSPPLENGGRQVTHYKVEYDELSSFTGGQNSGPFGSVLVSSSSVDGVSDVQLITVKIDKEGLVGNNEAYLSGTFSIEFDGQKTSQIPYNASPTEVKTALEDLCNIEEVSVTRSIHCSPDPSIGCMTPEGYSWLVHILNNNDGDQHYRHTSKLSTRTSHKLSVDGSFLFECSDVSRSTCSIGGNAVANVGTIQEVQSITIASSPFSVTIGGETSEVINIGDSISDVEDKLNAYSVNGVGRISVTCHSCVEDVVSSGDSLLLYFSSYRGDLPSVIVSDPAVVVSEVAKGSSQFVVGRAPYSTVISGLTGLHDWHVRVFAYNGIGEGLPEMVWPSPLRLTVVAPQVPENVAVGIESSTSLQVGWDTPGSIGGAQLSSFVIDYDTSPSFTTRNGMPLGQLTVSEADSDASIALVTQSYSDSIDPILRKRIVIDDIDVISQGIIEPGSALVIGGNHLTVFSINEESCGVTCLTMNEDFAGGGIKVYTGQDPRHYMHSINGLIPGTSYFVRVAAVNEKATSSFAFEGYPFFPISSTPMDVPTTISWATQTSISNSELRIDYGTPTSSDRPYGVNGSPSSQYHVEVAKATLYKPEIISLSTTADDEVSGFIELSVGYQSAYDLAISLGNQPTQLLVGPGSRIVNTMGDDLTSTLHPGEMILIEGELAEVQSVSADEIILKEYHIGGTNGMSVVGYRMNNYIGSSTISPGDNSLVETNGKNLESILRIGEVIQVTNNIGDKEYLTVTSITGSSVSFSPSYSGDTITKTPIYTKQKVIIPADSSSEDLKTSLENLEDVGSVEVAREGPNSSEGYTWLVTFTSNAGVSSCSIPSWCFASSIDSTNHLTISGLGIEVDGNYVQASFHNGRPRYELLGKSDHILYNEDASEWRLYSDSTSILSSVSSTDVTVPLVGWSNSASIALSTSTDQLLTGDNIAADVSIVQAGGPPSFEDIVFSDDLPAGQHEIQEVELLSDEDNLDGSFELSLGTATQKITVYTDESIQDFTTKLQSLAGIGNVSVTSSEPSDNDKFGKIWTITFLSNSGDVPSLNHYGTSNFDGTNVSLDIREQTKGELGDQYVIVSGLEEGSVYASRMYVENEAGVGPFTTLDQMFGGGIHPLTRLVSSPPSPPSIELGIITKSTAQIKFVEESSSNGSEVSSYKIEWTSSSFEDEAPADYDSMEIFTDGSSCGSLHLGEFTGTIRDETMCFDGSPVTIAIVASSLSSTSGGTFDIIYGDQSAKDVALDTSETDMADILSQVIDPNVQVTKHNRDDSVAWAITYPAGNIKDTLRVVDTFATGKNTAVNVYPILVIKTYSPENDASGDFSIVIDGESTQQLPVVGGHATVLQEMHRLNRIGKVSFLQEDSLLNNDNGSDFSMIIESFTADLTKIEVVPESNWRGLSARIFFKSPYGQASRTFNIDGLDKTKSYSIRAVAENKRGWSAQSNMVVVAPKSTVPGAPKAVRLEF